MVFSCLKKLSVEGTIAISSWLKVCNRCTWTCQRWIMSWTKEMQMDVWQCFGYIIVWNCNDEAKVKQNRYS
jgi:hypothetical protein